MDPEKESCGISFTSKEKNQKFNQINLCFVVGLSGRDPNSYTGVGWLYGVHDRAWTERPIFGKLRYMAASGLEKKCDIAAYLKKVDDLVKRVG